MSPSVKILCVYIEYLASKNLSPNTIKNKLSHIRTYLKQCRVPVDNAYDELVKNALDAVARKSEFQTKAKDPIPLNIVKQIILNIPYDIIGCNLRAALMLLLYGAYRQSEVLPPTASSFDPRKHITRGDIIFNTDHVVVIQKHGKNQQLFNQVRKCIFKPSLKSELCLVTALKTVISLTPTVCAEQPMFADGKGMPIPCQTLRSLWDTSLQKMGFPPKQYSLHSIRKGVSSLAYEKGASELDIKSYGCWSSDAYKTYIKTRSDLKINDILQNYL